MKASAAGPLCAPRACCTRSLPHGAVCAPGTNAGLRSGEVNASGIQLSSKAVPIQRIFLVLLCFKSFIMELPCAHKVRGVGGRVLITSTFPVNTRPVSPHLCLP